jgi:hypothetical protein
MEKHFDLYTSIGQGLLESHRQIESSQMFGKPCFKIKGKAFICFFQDEMVFKLEDPEFSTALKLAGAQLFDPSGKNMPMKEWVQVRFKHAKNWKKFAGAALEYVRKISK